MPVINRIAEFHDDMTAWRRDLHAHPELGLAEHRTSGIVQEKLREFGVDEVHAGLAGTGVVGVLRGRGPGPGAIGLRADMDALPITEETALPYASQNPGVMHACGHDGHTAMLLGAARYLAETRNFDGTVYLIFQPAEETQGGAGIMVRDGMFDRFPMQRVFGMHNWPLAPEGTFLWRDGPVMAAVANIDVTITGHGTHGAQPHLGVDPVFVAAQIISAAQGLVARAKEPVEGGVLSLCHIAAGNTYNVIPETVRMMGTARWFAPEVGDLLEGGFIRLATGIAESLGARADVSWKRNYPSLANDAETMALARHAAEMVAGPPRVQMMAKPTMGSEDFAFFAEARPAAFILLGAQRGVADAMVHHPRYDFNDAILSTGASFWATLVEQQLPRQG
jgi:hippurate hydrolase